MKIYKYLLIGILTFFINITSCLAWGGKYNYEVTSFTINGNNMATLTGWAIINARGGTGYWQGFEKVLLGNADRQSGVLNRTHDTTLYYDSNGNKFYGGYCNYGNMKYYDKNKTNVVSEELNSDYTYQYELEVLDENKKVIASSIKNSDIVKKLDSSLNPVSLTYAQAIKCNTKDVLVNNSSSVCKNDGDSDETACYENVGFIFNIDMSKLKKLSPNENYAFKLKVTTGKKSTCTSNCSESFNLTFIDLKTDQDFTHNYDYIDTTDKVKILVRGGFSWNEPDITKKSGTSIGNYPNATYCVSNIRYDKIMNVSWYNIKECNTNLDKGWVPASWVNPSGSLTYITPIKQDTTCVTTSPSEIKESANTCGGSVSAKNECLVAIDSNNYYDINCDENIISTFNPSSLSIKAGQGFSYDIKLKSVSTCTSTFNASLWKEHYNNLLNNYNNPNNSKEEKKMYENSMNDLKKIVNEYNSYKNASADEFFRNSSVSFDNLVAKMTINYKVNKKEKKDVIDFIKGSSTMISNNIIKDEKVNDLNISGLSNPYNYKITQEYSVDLMLPKVYINPTTGDISNTKLDSYVDAGNKYYTNLNADKGSYNINIKISNMGYANNISILNDKCLLTITSGINDNYYRTIDVSNPFIDINRQIGDNWNNDQYSFVNIIDKTIWTKSPLYLFNLTKANIKSIKNNNYLNGTNTYLGSDCIININGKTECSFLRDNNYFHSMTIKDD